MSDGFTGIDPDLMRDLGAAAGDLATTAENVRTDVLAILTSGQLSSDVGSLLATIADEAAVLSALCAERAPSVVLAATEGWGVTFDRLTYLLNDESGSSGMSSTSALETLRQHRDELDTDDDGEVSEDELLAAAESADPNVRAAAAFLTGELDENTPARTEGQSSVFIGPVMPSTEDQLEIVNSYSPDELDAQKAEWVAATLASGMGAAYTVAVRSNELDTTDFADELIVDGARVETLDTRQVPVPDLDDAWVSALVERAPEGTAAMVLVYTEEDANFAYTVDPVPDPPDWMSPTAFLTESGIASAAAAGSSLAARLNPVGAGASIAVGTYEVVDWLAPDAEARQDTTAVFDVEYHDADGNVITIDRNMAVVRNEVSGPLFSGPAVIVLPVEVPD